MRMSANKQPYDRVLRVSEYYRYILTSQLLVPDFAKTELLPDRALGALLQCIGEGTENAIRNCHLNLSNSRSNALKSMILAMLRTKRSTEFADRIADLDKLKAECLKNDPGVGHYRYNFAMLYLSVGVVSRCVFELEEMLTLFPGFGQAHAALALLYTISEEWSSGLLHARAALARHIELRPQLLDLCLSSCSFKLEKPVEGIFNYSALDENNQGFQAQISSELPSIDHAQIDHAGHDKKILFIYADDRYFYEHVLALICSLRVTGTDWVLHLHLCNPSTKLFRDLETLRQLVAPLVIRYSVEHVHIAQYGDAALYHSCMRFCRLYQLVSENPHTIVMVDADVLFIRNPEELAGLNDPCKTIGLAVTACEPFWATVRAGFCFFRRSEAALEFLGRLATYIYDNLLSRKGHWFLDQMGLSVLFAQWNKRQSVVVLPAIECCDSTYNDNAVIWAIVNDKVSMGKYNYRKLNLLKQYGLAK